MGTRVYLKNKHQGHLSTYNGINGMNRKENHDKKRRDSKNSFYVTVHPSLSHLNNVSSKSRIRVVVKI